MNRLRGQLNATQLVAKNLNLGFEAVNRGLVKTTSLFSLLGQGQLAGVASQFTVVTQTVGALTNALSKLGAVRGGLIGLAAGAGIFGLTQIVARGKAADAERKAVDDLQNANLRLAHSLQQTNDKLEQQGAISSATAEKIRAQLKFVEEMSEQGRGSQWQFHPSALVPFWGKSLSEIIARGTDPALARSGLAESALLGSVQDQLGKVKPRDVAGIVDAHREVARARTEAELEIKRAELVKETELVSASYAAGHMSLAVFLERRQQLAIESHRIELQTIESAEFESRQKLIAGTEAEKQKATADMVRLNTLRKVADIHLEQERNEIAADGLKERTKEQDETDLRRKASLQDELELRRQVLNLERQTLALERLKVDFDFRLTEGEKQRRKMELLKHERGIIAGSGLGANEIREGTLGVDSEMAGLQSANPASIREQMTLTIVQLQTQFGTTAQIIARGFTSIIGSAVEGIAGSIRGLLNLTMTWGEALRNIGMSIVQGIITSFANMVAEWIMSHVIMKGVLAAFSLFGITLKKTEAATTIATESSKTPVLGTNAVLAGISSYGVAAVIGLALVLAAIAAVSSFATGGYTGGGGKFEPAGIVHRKEFVLNAETTERIGVPRLEAMQRGEAMMDYGGGGNVSVALFDDRAKLREWVRSREGKVVIMDTVGKYQHEI